MAHTERAYIIGTAGHVDHGKTTLTKALTGVDTDRLKEEKERALSIDLGFAPLSLPSGRTVSVVDVPGHERFIKNMVAGVTSLDAVVLVVAADEGAMPQTREHLGILSLLEVGAGLVALTKADLVDGDWLALVHDELAALLRGTPFDGGPIVPCSGVTGMGLPVLLHEIDRLLARAPQRDTAAPFKMSIDRVFTVQGFGTVVTGSVDRGVVSVGSEVEVLPSGVRARIRSAEVHGAAADRVCAGQRAALNLQGLERSALTRGEVVAQPGSLRTTSMLDVRLRVLPTAGHPIEHWQRVRVHTGTAETLARVVVLGEGDRVAPGACDFVQLRLESPLAAATGDHCVIRTYSPSHTVAGGVILDANPGKHRGRDRREAAEGLAVRGTGDVGAVLLQALRASGETPVSRAALLERAGLHESEETASAIDRMLSSGDAAAVDGQAVVAAEHLQRAIDGIEGAVSAYHRAWPLRSGMGRSELRAALRETPTALFRAALGRLLREGRIEDVTAETVRLRGFAARLDEQAAVSASRLVAAAAETGILGLSQPELLSVPGADGELLRRLVAERSLVEVGDRFVAASELARARAALEAHLEAHTAVRVSEVRDLLGSSRKAIVPLLEYFDAIGVTERDGDVRRRKRRGDPA